MTATYRLRQHLRAIEQASTPEAQERRRKEQEAAARAASDQKVLFPEITPDNFSAANDYWLSRLDHWKHQLGVNV